MTEELIIPPRYSKKISDLTDFMCSLNGETDRGAALISIAILDDLLLQMLTEFLIDDSESTRSLKTIFRNFSSRLSLAFTLGLLEKHEFQEILTLNEIRNKFGHTWSNLTFESLEVRLTLDKLPWLGPLDIEPETQRLKFNFYISLLFSDLVTRSIHVLHEKRVTKSWPDKGRMLFKQFSPQT